MGSISFPVGLAMTIEINLVSPGPARDNKIDQFVLVPVWGKKIEGILAEP